MILEVLKNFRIQNLIEKNKNWNLLIIFVKNQNLQDMIELKEYWESLSGAGKVKFILKIVLVILLILFAIFNWQTVELHLVFTKVNVPLTVLVVLCVGVGLVISSIFDYRRFQKKDKEIKSLKKKLGEE